MKGEIKQHMNAQLVIGVIGLAFTLGFILRRVMDQATVTSLDVIVYACALIFLFVTLSGLSQVLNTEDDMAIRPRQKHSTYVTLYENPLAAFDQLYGDGARGDAGPDWERELGSPWAALETASGNIDFMWDESGFAFAADRNGRLLSVKSAILGPGSFGPAARDSIGTWLSSIYGVESVERLPSTPKGANFDIYLPEGKKIYIRSKAFQDTETSPDRILNYIQQTVDNPMGKASDGNMACIVTQTTEQAEEAMDKIREASLELNRLRVRIGVLAQDSHEYVPLFWDMEAPVDTA